MLLGGKGRIEKDWLRRGRKSKRPRRCGKEGQEDRGEGVKGREK
jgi:hypothetical protein